MRPGKDELTCMPLLLFFISKISKVLSPVRLFNSVTLSLYTCIYFYGSGYYAATWWVFCRRRPVTHLFPINFQDIENGKYDAKIKSFKTQFQSMMYTPQEILDKMYDGGGEEFGDNDTIICVEPDDGADGNRHRLDSGTGGSSFDSAVSSVSEGGSLTEDLSRMNIQKSLSLEDEVFPQGNAKFNMYRYTS